MAVYGSLGELSDAQLQAALDRFDLGRLVAAEAFTVGLFGKNVGLTTDRGRWVLRGDPWPANTDEQFRRERFFADAIRGACDVPVPWPFHIEADGSLLGWPYQLTPWMPGDQERNRAGAVALGRAAADLRRVTFDTFGAWSPELDGIEPFTGTAREWLELRTDTWIGHCGDRIADADIAYVRSVLPDDLDDVVPTYLHHDLKPGNCVCHDGAVSGLFDLGEGTTGDPIEDLARPTWDLAHHDAALVAPFLLAYEETSGVRVPIDRLRAYLVLDLVVMWEFGTRQEPRWIDEPSFESWAARFLSPVEGALQVFLDHP